VGYFERSRQLEPGKNVLSLPASHVDDALKTMVILADGAKLTVSAVEVAKVIPTEMAPKSKGELVAAKSTHDDGDNDGAPERTEANPSGQVPAITKVH
jgi:hypothetical protein